MSILPLLKKSIAIFVSIFFVSIASADYKIYLQNKLGANKKVDNFYGTLLSSQGTDVITIDGTVNLEPFEDRFVLASTVSSPTLTLVDHSLSFTYSCSSGGFECWSSGKHPTSVPLVPLYGSIVGNHVIDTSDKTRGTGVNSVIYKTRYIKFVINTDYTISYLIYRKSKEGFTSSERINLSLKNADFNCELPEKKLSLSETDQKLIFDILDVRQASSFEENLDIAQTAGADALSLHVTWSQIENSPLVYSDPNGSLEALSNVAEEQNMKLSLTIRPIDLTGKTVPTDLSDDPLDTDRFNSLQMLNRFTNMLDHILTNYVDPNLILNIQVGNEIDGYDASAEHEEFWSDYGWFLTNINQWLSTNYPMIKLGFTLTYNGAVNGTMRDAGVWTSLADAVDVIGITYYPLDTNYQALSPDLVASHFESLITEFNSTDIPIYLQEVGYPTSAYNGSSEVKQAQFFSNFFSAWDMHKGKIPVANIVRLNDISQAEAINLAGPYGIGTIEFIEYLRTLGLRKHGGNSENKIAYDVIIGHGSN